MPSNKVTKQKTGKSSGGMSSPINYATGSGSRPGGGKVKISSSNPSSPQMIRPKNTIGS